MSTRMMEAARAFATIAEHLPPEKRKALAEKIAGLIDSSITPPSKVGAEARIPAETLPNPDHVVFDESARFLADHGYSKSDLVKASGRLEEFLKRHPDLLRESALRKFLLEDVGMSR